ncbi:TIF1B factor, partial [Polypterus senegalus]
MVMWTSGLQSINVGTAQCFDQVVVAAQIATAENRKENSREKWMQCPVCKQTFQLHDVVENYFIRDTPSSSKSNGNKTKEVCICCEDKAEASSFCIDCSEWLCDACVGAHQRVKITKDHTVRRRDEGADSAAATGVTPDRLLFCPTHRHEPLKIFCVTCEVLTCRDCQLHDHKDHKYQFLENAIPEQRLILENILKHLQECTYGVRKSARNLRSMIKELKEVERRVKVEIRMAIHSLMKELNKRGTFLAQEVQLGLGYHMAFEWRIEMSYMPV